MVRTRHHPLTRVPVKRRTAEGVSKREIIRCLKRYIAREVYSALPRRASRQCSHGRQRTLRDLNE
jgi:hypothetical protein